MSNNTTAPNYSMLLSRFVDSNQWERALETAHEWLSQEPETTRAHLAAGQSLINLGRHPEAKPHIAKVLEKQPQNAFAHRMMSIICFNQREFKAADDAIQQAISIQPEVHHNWYHLARMCYKQRDFKSAQQFAEKARALSPTDANTLNLLALSRQEEGAALNPQSNLELYLQALELDPENALIHNNIGVYYLNISKDYKTAEKFFRQGLFFDPSSKLIRKNLFFTIKRRDLVYKILCWPRDVLAKTASLTSRARKKSFIGWILLIPVWIFAARFVVIGLALWFMFFWPLVKVYERLAVGEILSKAGEVGSKRGGLFGYRGWPFALRMALFFIVLLLFWGGVYILGQNETGRPVLGFLFAIALLGIVGSRIPRLIKRSREGSHSRRRAKKMRHLIQPEPRKSRRDSPHNHSNSHE